MAAAIGIGIDVEAPEGNMIVDIGGGSTEIAVISLGGIVSNNSIRTAGDDLTADIQEYMYRQHNVKVSERMAERIKINVGSALTDLGDEAPEDFVVHGPNRITALPMEVPVCYQEIAHCLDKTVSKIENAVLSALENTPPELYADIVQNGIYLAGGGALLRGLDKRLTDKMHIPFHVPEDPLHSVAKGAGVALNLLDFLKDYYHWLLFVFLEVVSGFLLFQYNNYQGSVWFSSANMVTGKVYEWKSEATKFFTQSQANEQLTRRNILLEQHVDMLRRRYMELTYDSTVMERNEMKFLRQYDLIPAKVVDNSLDSKENLLTIDKGRADGVEVDMGVVCGKGVVGVVYLVSEHYSVVIPVLNASSSRISCAIRNRGSFGYLHWYGGDPSVAYVEDVPRHAKFKLGEWVVTSGFSSIFPSGVSVGKIEQAYNSRDGLSYKLKIRLSTDFTNLRDVLVISDKSIAERAALLQAARDSINKISGTR